VDFFFADGAGFFTVAAVIGTCVFALRLVLLLVAGDVGAHGLDLHGDIHFDHSGGHHPEDAFQILSTQGLIAFAMGFGWGGLGGLRGAEWSWLASAGFGFLTGLGMLYLMAGLMRTLQSLESSGNVSLGDALDRVGDIYVSVPAGGKGRGQVRLTLNNRQRIYDAVTEAGEIPSNTRVRVIRVNDDRTLTVVPD